MGGTQIHPARCGTTPCRVIPTALRRIRRAAAEAPTSAWWASTRLSDHELLARVAGRGDEAAFAELYARKARPVYTLIARILSDHGLAEDAVQNAFVSVWRSAGTYRPERGSVDAWLFAVARNAAFSLIPRSLVVAAAELDERADPGPTPDEAALADAERFRIHSAVERLPCREREIIERAYFCGLSQTAIAAELGVPLGTVKTRNRAALARLSRILTGEDGDA